MLVGLDELGFALEENVVVDGLVVCFVAGGSVTFLCIVSKLMDGLTVGRTGTSNGLITNWLGK